MTKADIIALIATNLADYSGIVPSKHREVELAILNFVSTANQVEALNKGSILVGDVGVGTVGQVYTVTGDVVTAILEARTAKGNIITVTVLNPHADMFYKVDISSPESLGTMEIDNDIHPPIWQKINENSFYIYIEDYGGTQNLKIHFETKIAS